MWAELKPEVLEEDFYHDIAYYLVYGNAPRKEPYVEDAAARITLSRKSKNFYKESRPQKPTNDQFSSSPSFPPSDLHHTQRHLTVKATTASKSKANNPADQHPCHPSILALQSHTSNPATTGPVIHLQGPYLSRRQYMDLYICGSSWSTARETTDSFWNYEKNDQIFNHLSSSIPPSVRPSASLPPSQRLPHARNLHCNSPPVQRHPPPSSVYPCSPVGEGQSATDQR